MILDFILFALGFYFIYKVIFELVIPLFRTTQKIRQQFSNMQDPAQDQMNRPPNGRPRETKPAAGQHTSTKAGDYIDFEEVK